MLTKSSIIFALIISAAHADEYVMPRIPTEAEKVEALKLGYIANGFSMDGRMQGSIDVSEAFKPKPLEPVPPGQAETPVTKTAPHGVNRK